MHRFSYTNFTKTMHFKTFYSIIKKLNRNKHHKKTTSRRKADKKIGLKQATSVKDRIEKNLVFVMNARFLYGYVHIFYLYRSKIPLKR